MGINTQFPLIYFVISLSLTYSITQHKSATFSKIVQNVTLKIRSTKDSDSNHEGSPFLLSNVGEQCLKPVNSSYECQEAASFFRNAVFSTIKGQGNDLPYGCISDKVTPGRHYMYWHSVGNAISQDPRMQQVCFEPNDLLRDFFRERKKVLRKEDDEWLGSELILSTSEKIANDYLMQHKQKEVLEVFNDHNTTNPTVFPPSQNFLTARPLILKSEVFKFIKNMPKGGALHLHDFGIIPIDFIVHNISYNNELYMCYDDPSRRGHTRFGWFSRGETNSECSWISVFKAREELGSNFIDKEISDSLQFTENEQLMYNLKGSDSGHINVVWKYFESKIMAIADIVNYLPVFEKCMYQGFDEFRRDNVQYIEIRTVLIPVCTKTLNEGCHALKGLEVANLYKRVADKFLFDHPDDFCEDGIKMIYAPLRRQNTSMILETIKLAEKVTTSLPSFFIGMDLVGQEDLGRPLIDFAKELLEAQNRTKLDYFFHAGETNWKGLPTDINIIDAILLGTKRIGHGYAISKHPEAKKIAKERVIPLEICPISNQVLALVDDLRNHPAAALIQEGFPLVISSDDPDLWGASGLSYDYYEAFMGLAGLNMDLRLLKKLSLNSLNYSKSSPKCRKKFEDKWNIYMNEFGPIIDVI